MFRIHGLLALMQRSLRVDERLSRTHWSRFALLALTYWLLVQMIWRAGNRDAPGLELFSQMCVLNFFAIVLGGLGLFCSVIAEEKEEGTLGLMRLAGVQPLSLIVGKFVPKLVACLVLLGSQFPFVMLAITLGGVSVEQLLSAYTCLATFLFALANLGLLCSVVCSKASGASTAAVVILLVYLSGPFLLHQIASGLAQDGWIRGTGIVMLASRGLLDLFVETNAFWKMSRVLATGGSRGIIDAQSVAHVVVGCVLFLLAWRLFEPMTSESRLASRGPRRARPAKGTIKQSWLSPGRAWKAALVWKEYYFQSGGLKFALGQSVVLAVVISVIAGIQWRSEGRIFWTANAMGLGWASVLVIIVLTPSLISRCFMDEIKAKTLTNLVLLPQGTHGLIAAKIAGVLLALIPAVITFGAAVAFIALYTGFFNDRDFRDFNRNVMDAEFLAWLAWWCVQYLCFLHVVLFVSLYVRWGAMPLALFCQIGLMLLVAVLTESEDAVFIINGLVALAGMPLCLFGSVEAISKLAAD